MGDKQLIGDEGPWRNSTDGEPSSSVSTGLGSILQYSFATLLFSEVEGSLAPINKLRCSIRTLFMALIQASLCFLKIWLDVELTI
jgi:hypothetical protein